MKVIQARRDRNDKISKRMSEYLLKGYKMLGSSCNDCHVSLDSSLLTFGYSREAAFQIKNSDVFCYSVLLNISFVCYC